MITLTAGWIFKWLAPTPLPRLTWQQRLGPGSQTHTTHLAQLMRWGSSRCLQCPRAGGSVTLGTTLVTLAGSTHVTPPRPRPGSTSAHAAPSLNILEIRGADKQPRISLGCLAAAGGGFFRIFSLVPPPQQPRPPASNSSAN